MVTLDYEQNQVSCPKHDCGKKKCCCSGLTFYSVAPSLTEELAPRNGLYSNAIVRYEATGAVYIFSKEGVPVLVKEGNAS